MNILKIVIGQTGWRVVITTFLFSSIFLFYLVPQISFQRNAVSVDDDTVAIVPPVIVQEEVSFGSPRRLKIPGINVDAAVELVGLTPSGDMDTPKGLGNVAWFNLGSRPGESGSAVITGHSGIWENGEETVFNNLHTLRKDDTFSIEDEKGVISTFIVRESRKYDPEADASDVFISNDGKSHLNLITCIGAWNEASQSYPDRLVVFADKE